MNAHPNEKHVKALRDAVADYKDEASLSDPDPADASIPEGAPFHVGNLPELALQIMADLAPFAHAPIRGTEVAHQGADIVEYSMPRAIIDGGSILVLDPQGFRYVDAVHVLNLDARFPLTRETSPGGQSSLEAQEDGGWGFKVDRARGHLATIPGAISGQGAHAQTYMAAVQVGCGFGLKPDECFGLLLREYNPRCQPPWGEEELREKVDRAYQQEGGRNWMLGPDESGQEFCGPPPGEGGPPHPLEGQVGGEEAAVA